MEFVKGRDRPPSELRIGLPSPLASPSSGKYKVKMQSPMNTPGRRRKMTKNMQSPLSSRGSTYLTSPKHSTMTTPKHSSTLESTLGSLDSPSSWGPSMISSPNRSNTLDTSMLSSPNRTNTMGSTTFASSSKGNSTLTTTPTIDRASHAMKDNPTVLSSIEIGGTYDESLLTSPGQTPANGAGCRFVIDENNQRVTCGGNVDSNPSMGMNSPRRKKKPFSPRNKYEQRVKEILMQKDKPSSSTNRIQSELNDIELSPFDSTLNKRLQKLHIERSHGTSRSEENDLWEQKVKSTPVQSCTNPVNFLNKGSSSWMAATTPSCGTQESRKMPDVTFDSDVLMSFESPSCIARPQKQHDYENRPRSRIRSRKSLTKESTPSFDSLFVSKKDRYDKDNSEGPLKSTFSNVLDNGRNELDHEMKDLNKRLQDLENAKLNPKYTEYAERYRRKLADQAQAELFRLELVQKAMVLENQIKIYQRNKDEWNKIKEQAVEEEIKRREMAEVAKKEWKDEIVKIIQQEAKARSKDSDEDLIDQDLQRTVTDREDPTRKKSETNNMLNNTSLYDKVAAFNEMTKMTEEEQKALEAEILKNIHEEMSKHTATKKMLKKPILLSEFKKRNKATNAKVSSDEKDCDILISPHQERIFSNSTLSGSQDTGPDPVSPDPSNTGSKRRGLFGKRSGTSALDSRKSPLRERLFSRNKSPLKSSLSQGSTSTKQITEVRVPDKKEIEEEIDSVSERERAVTIIFNGQAEKRGTKKKSNNEATEVTDELKDSSSNGSKEQEKKGVTFMETSKEDGREARKLRFGSPFRDRNLSKERGTKESFGSPSVTKKRSTAVKQVFACIAPSLSNYSSAELEQGNDRDADSFDNQHNFGDVVISMSSENIEATFSKIGVASTPYSILASESKSSSEASSKSKGKSKKGKKKSSIQKPREESLLIPPSRLKQSDALNAPSSETNGTTTPKAATPLSTTKSAPIPILKSSMTSKSSMSSPTKKHDVSWIGAPEIMHPVYPRNGGKSPRTNRKVASSLTVIDFAEKRGNSDISSSSPSLSIGSSSKNSDNSSSTRQSDKSFLKLRRRKLLPTQKKSSEYDPGSITLPPPPQKDLPLSLSASSGQSQSVQDAFIELEYIEPSSSLPTTPGGPTTPGRLKIHE